MCQKNDLPLSLKSDTFNALCSDYDQILRSTLQGMEETEQDTAEINIKVKITLTPDSAPDFEVRNQTRAVTKPKFDHTVSSVIQHKEKKTGTLAGNYELVWDRESCQYVMRPIDNGQMTMFDEEGKKKSTFNPDDIVVVGGELPPAKRELPAPVGEVINADFTVVEGGTAPQVGFDTIGKYTGKELCCEWTEDESTVVIRCLNDGEVLLDAKDHPELELEKHVGHDILCTVFEKNGTVIAAVTCDTCDAVLYMAVKPVQKVDPDTPYGWLRQFVGVDMKVMEAMGNYTVRTADNKVVLSSATSPDATFYVPAEKLAPHVGHAIICILYGENNDDASVLIECDTCGETLFRLDAPDRGETPDGEVAPSDDLPEGDEGTSTYEYENPDEEGEPA